ncbi:sigma-70 family RNA polymerase sigma factor [Vulgatibacter incomptus]|uniref:RNA polymerase sigma factor n=1 Tax=Vulgatibacter incomptus TaxID=1391653 RepID=A0A0K1PE91_9BACT|nr:RNA polymerase factor sigma-32 [Vulgatibacter incomptus]AKU91449.1 RNA polymerase sigma factor RpoH [Vulgatibacter incomptus]
MSPSKKISKAKESPRARGRRRPDAEPEEDAELVEAEESQELEPSSILEIAGEESDAEVVGEENPALRARHPALAELDEEDGAEEESSVALSRTDPLARYMQEVNRHPLLSREEEHELAVRYTKTGEVDAAYRLVASNLRLVVKIAYEYRRAAFNVLDLIQEGNVGLLHAVKKYDPYRGVKLSSYAAWWIRAYILRFVMDNWRMVKLGTTQAQRKLFFNLRKEQRRLAAEGFEVGPKLLAERLGVTEREVEDMDRRLSGDEASLHAPMNDDGDATLGDRLALPARAADETLAHEELKNLLRAELEELAKDVDERELFILENRMRSDEPLTLQEIGERFGISRERARQIEAKLVARLRERLMEKVPDLAVLSLGGD